MKAKGMCQKWCAGIMAGLLLMGVAPTFQAEGAVYSYTKAATYVSDAWVSNFWNTESDHMEEELAQIAADGFNTIILVVPWREFQPGVEPISYNSYTFEKLDRVMRAADAHQLAVILRVGYAWDYYADAASPLRFRELVRDPVVRNAWISYVEKLYQVASSYANFSGGFITWEDFWNYVEDAPSFGSGQYGRDEAKKIGFQDYLKENYTLEELNKIYRPVNEFTDYSQTYIPKKDHTAYSLFYNFYDEFLNELLADSQKVFPDLSMEVRLDVDPVEAESGEGLMGVPHYQTFSCGESSYASLMYSVSMGRAAGQLLTAEEAMETMNEQLEIVRENNGDKPIFIDQLLYTDATKEFEYNARLHDNQRASYLTALPDTLRRYTNGYGIWTYRNYLNNPVYNSQFALGNRGWQVTGGSIQERDGSRQMQLQEGGSISQKIGHRISGRSTHENHVRFKADSDRPVTVTVELGRATQTVTVEGKGQFDLNLGSAGYYEVKFTAEDEVYLDNIEVYNFVQDGQLYDVDGNELSCLEAIRSLNGALN